MNPSLGWAALRGLRSFATAFAGPLAFLIPAFIAIGMWNDEILETAPCFRAFELDFCLGYLWLLYRAAAREAKGSQPNYVAFTIAALAANLALSLFLAWDPLRWLDDEPVDAWDTVVGALEWPAYIAVFFSAWRFRPAS